MGNNSAGYVGSGITLATAVMTSMSIDNVLSIVLTVLGCISGALSIMLTLYKWIKKVKEDGQLTEKEIDEGINIIQNGISELTKIAKKEEKEDGDKNK